MQDIIDGLHLGTSTFVNNEYNVKARVDDKREAGTARLFATSKHHCVRHSQHRPETIERTMDSEIVSAKDFILVDVVDDVGRYRNNVATKVRRSGARRSGAVMSEGLGEGRGDKLDLVVVLIFLRRLFC